MGLVGDALTFGRFSLGLREYLSRRMSAADARAILRRRLDERDDTFLAFLKKGFFGNPRSPYRPLFELAGVEYGDVEQMVRARGIEATLEELYDAGVYVTYQEFKGRKPIVRGGRELPIDARDFSNPYLGPSYQGRTSGSTGAGTRVSIDLEHLWDQMPIKVLVCEAHGLLDVPMACWRPIPPVTSGLSNVLRGPIVGNIPERWFTPVTSRDARTPLKFRLATGWILAVARLWGHRLPKPERVPLDEPGPVVDWVEDALRRRGACYVSAFISTSLRVAVAARERGLDLTGVTFRGGGEPPTPGKVAVVESTGGRWVPDYGTTESGQIGAGCAAPVDCNDLHVLKDRLAIVQRPFEVPGWNLTVGAFFVTTLTPSSPKLMLNAGIDDYGVLEDRKCGCPFEEFGYAQHVREIRSFSKLTGEGLTLLETDMVNVLDQVLPARFGGSPLDYQLMEEEDADGRTRLTLIVSPRIDLPDEQAAVRAVLDASQTGHRAFAAAVWEQAGSLRVKRMEPVWSAGGKFLPLCVSERLKAASATRGRR
jgi:hypothetical protein